MYRFWACNLRTMVTTEKIEKLLGKLKAQGGGSSTAGGKVEERRKDRQRRIFFFFLERRSREKNYFLHSWREKEERILQFNAADVWISHIRIYNKLAIMTVINPYVPIEDAKAEGKIKFYENWRRPLKEYVRNMWC